MKLKTYLNGPSMNNNEINQNKPLINIKHILQTTKVGDIVQLEGWVRSTRLQKKIGFIDLTDGSCMCGIQIVIEQSKYHPSSEKCELFENLNKSVTIGSSISIEGTILENPSGKGKEVSAMSIRVVGSCDATDYPLQKKRHSFEFLRTIAHLRTKTNTLAAIGRIRHQMSYHTHKYFNDNGYIHLHAPIITTSDCEGAGDMFLVETNDKNEHFFGKKAHLTVSGQLHAEIYAQSFKRTYTFGPTFRAENSHTSRHLAEFWMIEPELSFINVDDLLNSIESYIKYVTKSILENCMEDLNLFNKFISPGIIERHQELLNSPFARISYTEAIDILKQAEKTFEHNAEWGCDLQSEHERYICEVHTKKPTFVTDYPKEIKAFYMKLNDDGKTVSAVDLIVPGIGELVGGSMREDEISTLKIKLQENELSEETYWWYLELRKYGSTPHGGYGVGFERFIKYITGMDNIRDVIPFPRYQGYAEF
ncbi:asparagine--tRNA ligase [Chlamydiia bacterium]|nr:asparagine--tRNA ligase [Chlamydiia bacterium]